MSQKTFKEIVTQNLIRAQKAVKILEGANEEQKKSCICLYNQVSRLHLRSNRLQKGLNDAYEHNHLLSRLGRDYRKQKFIQNQNASKISSLRKDFSSIKLIFSNFRTNFLNDFKLVVKLSEKLLDVSKDLNERKQLQVENAIQFETIENSILHLSNSKKNFLKTTKCILNNLNVGIKSHSWKLTNNEIEEWEKLNNFNL